MRNPNFCVYPGGPVLVAFVAWASVTSAATVIWDGGSGGANASGLWETGVNWNTVTDVVPAAADTASLANVTSGTRTVTISSGSPQIIRALSISQTTVGAFNVLQLDDNLTISGGATPFAITATAGQDSIVTNIAANKTLLASNTASITSSSYAGTLNMAAGSTFKVSAVGTNADLTVGTFGGPINATGAGAQIIFQRTRNLGGSLRFNGAIGVTGEGSTLTLKSLSASNAVTSIGTVTFAGNDGAGNAVNLGAGTQFTISASTGTYAFSNKVSLAGTASPVAAAQMTITGTASGTTGNFNGGLDLGAGAQMLLTDTSIAVNVAGTSSWGTGSVLTAQFSGAQSSGRFTNSGTLTMDGAAMKLDWAATTNNSGSPRDYKNTGTWTLKNGSSIVFFSSTGRQLGGYGNSTTNANSGTLIVQSGSSMVFDGFQNTGAATFGSNTSGISDLEVKLGSPTLNYTTNVLSNGYTTGDSTMTILGNTYLGRTTDSTGTTYLQNGTNAYSSGGTTTTDASTGSIINIGDGTTPLTFTVGNRGVVITNATDNTMNLKAGATLLLKSVATTNITGSTTLTNRGTLMQAGTLSFQGNYNGARTLSNSAASTYQISGVDAAIKALPGVGVGYTTSVAAITFTSAGLVTGATAHDKLTYTNSTGNATLGTLALSVNSGEITPGNGSNGTGLASIGTLEFANTNITLTGTSKLTFDIGGTAASSRFDQVIVGNKTFALGSNTGSVLDVWLVNSYGTETAQSYILATATGGSITGSFTTLRFNGQVMTDEYTVGIVGGNQLVLNLSAGLGLVPEPSTYAVLMAAGAGLVVALRRRRRA